MKQVCLPALGGSNVRCSMRHARQDVLSARALAFLELPALLLSRSRLAGGDVVDAGVTLATSGELCAAKRDIGLPSAQHSGPLLAVVPGMTVRTILAGVFLLLALHVCVGCDESSCQNNEADLSVELGYAGMGEWLPIEEGDEVLVSPGSQGWGLMVEVNIRIDGLSADEGAYSTASVHLERLSEAREQLTAPGTRMLAALCQDDGALMSRNRRVEFGEDYMEFEELDGIDEGFDALLSIEVEFHDGTQISQELGVHLYREQ